MTKAAIDGYLYADAVPGHHHEYLLPKVVEARKRISLAAAERPLFELGCENGSTAKQLTALGWNVTGVDPSEE